MSRSRRNLFRNNRTWDGKPNLGIGAAIIEDAETILVLQRLVDQSDAAVCDDFTPFPKGGAALSSPERSSYNGCFFHP